MTNFRYTKAHIDFLTIKFKTLGIEDLTNEFNEEFKLNKTPLQIKSTLKSRKITCGRKSGQLRKGKSKLFTTQDKQWLEEHYKYLEVHQLGQAFRYFNNHERSDSQIKSYLKNNKILSGRTGHFKINSAPANKGTKGLTSANITSFKKGSLPANTKPIGHERVCTSSHYVLIKVEEPNPYTKAKTRYRPKHHIIWENINGEIPHGHVVIFKDNNPLNSDISNLVCMSKREHLYVNKAGHGKLPAEFKETAISIAKLKIQIKDKSQDISE